MSDRRRGLGRGLGALIGDDPSPTAEQAVRLIEVDLSRVHPNPRQPRSAFDEAELAELAQAMSEVGLLQPIVVRPLGADYELVAGERRLRAAGLLGWSSIPALVRQTSDDELLREALLENLHRVALSPIDEAAAYQQLLADFGGTQEELAHRLGRSRPQITNTLRLLRLPPAIQRRVAAGVLSAGHARALLALPTAAAMEELAERIVAEGLSVRSTEEIATLTPLDPSRRARVTANAQERPGAAAEGEAADRLGRRLDTRVTVRLGARRGRIIIDVADAEDLLRMVALIDPSGR